MSDNEDRPGYYVDELQEHIAELEAALEAIRDVMLHTPPVKEEAATLVLSAKHWRKTCDRIAELEAIEADNDRGVKIINAHRDRLVLRIEKLETALQLIVDYPGTKGVMLKRFIAVAQKALEQEN